MSVHDHDAALVDKADHVWSEYRYHHDHFWRSFYRFTTAVVVVAIIPYAPYVPDDFRTSLGNSILFFPLTSAAVGLFGSWLLEAEYWRLHRIYKALEEARRDADIAYEWFEFPTLYSFKIGLVMARSVGAGAIAIGSLSALDLVFKSPDWLLRVVTLLFLGGGSLLAIAVSRRSRARRRSRMRRSSDTGDTSP